MDVVSIEPHVGGLDPDVSALGHGVARIGSKVHQDLFDLHGVHSHAA
jgi:hypothetical protein